MSRGKGLATLAAFLVHCSMPTNFRAVLWLMCYVHTIVAVPEDYSVFNWLNSISSPTVTLRQLKPKVGTSLADRLKLLRTKFKLSKRFYSRTTHINVTKVVKK